jgi:hypothetical protein
MLRYFTSYLKLKPDTFPKLLWLFSDFSKENKMGFMSINLEKKQRYLNAFKILKTKTIFLKKRFPRFFLFFAKFKVVFDGKNDHKKEAFLRNGLFYCKTIS